MARGWTITAFALAALLPAGIAKAQSIIEPDPPAKAQTPAKQQPAGKPPAKKQSGGAATQGLVSPPQNQGPPHPAIQAVADRAAMYFIDEHAFCAAYFSVAGSCLAEDDPEKPKSAQSAKLLLARALAYEKQYNLAPGSLKAKAEEAEKGMAAKVWRCGSASLVLDDFKISCRALAEEPEARMRQLLLQAADEIGRESSARSTGPARPAASAGSRRSNERPRPALGYDAMRLKGDLAGPHVTRPLSVSTRRLRVRQFPLQTHP